MATGQVPSPIPVTTQVKQNWDRFCADPDVKTSGGKLDRKRIQAEVSACCEHFTTWTNFQNYKNSLQRLKGRQLALSSTTESAFASRFEESIDAYQSLVSSSRNVCGLLAQSGFDKHFERHSKNLFWQLPLTPIYPHMADMFKTMGMPDSEISEHTATLKANDWDILGLHGSDGTISGLVNLADQQVPVLRKMASAVKLHGLPVIEGSGGPVIAAATVATVIYFADTTPLWGMILLL